MPISLPLRQAGSLKGNSKGCRVAGIKRARGVLAIMHGDNSNKLAVGAHHNNSSRGAGAHRLLHNSSRVPGAHSLLLNSSRGAGVRKPPLSSNQPIPGVARVPPSNNNLRPGVTRAPVPHLEVLAREETNQPGMQL